jgi:hypothetical protein
MAESNKKTLECKNHYSKGKKTRQVLAEKGQQKLREQQKLAAFTAI